MITLLLLILVESVCAQTGHVILYEHGDFRGRHEVFTNNDPDLGDNEIGLHQASSVKIPEGTRVYLYENRNFGGKFIVLYGDVRNLSKTQLGNDRVASIKIERMTEDSQEDQTGVVLYDQVALHGRREVFYATTSDLGKSFFNDQAVSVAIPEGVKVTLFEHGGFKGKGESFYEDDTDLSDNRIDAHTVSSLRIEPYSAWLRDGSKKEPVILYTDVNFQGVGEPFFSDDPDLNNNTLSLQKIGPVAIPLGIRIRSVKMPEGVRVELFSKKDFKGKSTILIREQWDFSPTSLARSRINSMRIIYANEKMNPGFQGQFVRLYSEPFFRGNMEEVREDIPTLKNHRVGNDRLMSIYIPAGMEVKLFQDKNFTGRFETLTQSDPDLFDNAIGAGTVTSMRIQKTGENTPKSHASLKPQLMIRIWKGEKKGAIFDASGTVLPRGVTARYELDYDGDGKWDYTESYPPQIEYAIPGGGDFTAHFKVTTDDGYSARISRDYHIKPLQRKAKTDSIPVVASTEVPLKSTRPAVNGPNRQVLKTSQPALKKTFSRTPTGKSAEEQRLAKEAYEKAFDAMSQLLEQGRGDTPEGQKAYETYQKAKARYERSRGN
jgi:hypothetical protein